MATLGTSALQVCAAILSVDAFLIPSAEATLVTYLNSYLAARPNTDGSLPVDLLNATMTVDLTSNAKYPYLQVGRNELHCFTRDCIDIMINNIDL